MGESAVVRRQPTSLVLRNALEASKKAMASAGLECLLKLSESALRLCKLLLHHVNWHDHTREDPVPMIQLPPNQQLVAPGRWPVVGEKESRRDESPWRVSV